MLPYGLIMHMVALRANAHHRRLSGGCPNMGGGRLKIQAHFIKRHNLPVGMILQEVRYFFSRSASNSAKVASLGRER